MENMTYVLLAIIILQQIFFFWNQHKLVNKIMSRTFYDYKLACNKTEKPKNGQIISLNDDSEKFLEQEMGRI